MESRSPTPAKPISVIHFHGLLDRLIRSEGGPSDETLLPAFQLLDDVIDLSSDPDETGKVPGTDLRAGVPTMPFLLLGQRDDDASTDLRERIDEGVARIADGADPVILDEPLAELRDHEATRATLDLAHSWSRDAIAALDPLPDGPVREGLTRFARAVADRSS